MSLYINEEYYLSEFEEFEKILETSNIDESKFLIDDAYCALIDNSLYLKIDGSFSRITEIIYSELLKNYSGFITGIIQGEIKSLNLPKFNSLKVKFQFENGRLVNKELCYLNNINFKETIITKPSQKLKSVLYPDWTFRGDIKDNANPNINYCESDNNDYKSYENPWRNVFGNSDEAETAYWNTD